MSDFKNQAAKLEEMQTELLAELGKLGVQDPANSADWVTSQTDVTAEADLNDVADRTEDYNANRATLANLETRYNNIVEALKKIKEGTYGICETCGHAIEEDRLNANPAARTCKADMG